MLIVGFICAQILLLVVIILVLKKMIFSDTDSAINRLARLNQVNRQKEKVLAEKIEQAQQYIEDEKLKIKEAEAKIKLESKRSVQKLHEDAVKKARDEADEIIKKAYESKDQMQKDAALEAQGMVLNFCSSIIGDVLGPVIGKQLNDSLALNFIAEAEKADWSKLNPEGNSVEVTTARELDPAISEKIRVMLSSKIGREMTLSFRIDPTVIGGIRLAIGPTIVDGTVAERVNDIAQQKKEELSIKFA